MPLSSNSIFLSNTCKSYLSEDYTRYQKQALSSVASASQDHPSSWIQRVERTAAAPLYGLRTPRTRPVTSANKASPLCQAFRRKRQSSLSMPGQILDFADPVGRSSRSWPLDRALSENGMTSLASVYVFFAWLDTAIWYESSRNLQ